MNELKCISKKILLYVYNILERLKISKVKETYRSKLLLLDEEEEEERLLIAGDDKDSSSDIRLMESITLGIFTAVDEHLGEGGVESSLLESKSTLKFDGYLDLVNLL